MYTISKDMTDSKIKADVRNRMYTIIAEALKNQGCIVEWGKVDKKNVFMIKADNVTLTNGEEVPVVATIAVSAKDFQDRKTAKKQYYAFDFDAAAQKYKESIDSE